LASTLDQRSAAAARILGVSDARIATLLWEYAEKNETEVRAKDAICCG